MPHTDYGSGHNRLAVYQKGWHKCLQAQRIHHTGMAFLI